MSVTDIHTLAATLGSINSPARKALQERIAGMTDQQVDACIRVFGNDTLDADCTLIRASLLDEFESRHGEDAVDALLDELGL